MVCKKCNTPLADGATFCSNCGTPTALSSNLEEPTYPYETPINPHPPIQPAPNNTLFFVLSMAIIVLLLGCILIFFFFMNTEKNKSSNRDNISPTKGTEQSQTNPQTKQLDQANSQSETQASSSLEDIQSSQVTEQDISQTDSNIQAEEENEDTIPSTQEMISLAYSGMEAPASDFVFPYSRERLLTEEDLYILEATQPDANHDDITDQEHSNSQMAINEILARYGYPFKSNASKKTGQEAYNKFSSLSWYQEIKPLCSYSSANDLIENLTSIERQNIAIIDEWQKQHGCYY